MNALEIRDLTKKYTGFQLDGLNLIDNETIEEMAVLFKMFSDPTRLKIMNLLLLI